MQMTLIRYGWCLEPLHWADYYRLILAYYALDPFHCVQNTLLRRMRPNGFWDSPSTRKVSPKTAAAPIVRRLLHFRVEVGLLYFLPHVGLFRRRFD